jgi:hypothetical protein
MSEGTQPERETEEFGNKESIQMYMHCGQCLEESKKPNVECGWTKWGFQVWCKNHDFNICHVDFEGHKHPADSTRPK